MIVMREMRRRARFIVGPVFGMALTGYFVYHLIEGDRGLLAWMRLSKELRVEQDNLHRLGAERAALAGKVADLRPDHLDRDLLDARVRAGLNLVAPDEIVIMRPQNGH